MDFKKKFDTCASSPHINAKLHDVPAQHENLRQAQYHANLDYDAAPLQLAQLNADPATGVVFQRPHLHNKTEMTLSNFDLLQNSKDFNCEEDDGIRDSNQNIDKSGKKPKEVSKGRYTMKSKKKYQVAKFELVSKKKKKMIHT